MEPVTQEQALNALRVLEQMRQIYKSSGAEGDTLRVAMETVNRYILEAGTKPKAEPVDPPATPKEKPKPHNGATK